MGRAPGVTDRQGWSPIRYNWIWHKNNFTNILPSNSYRWVCWYLQHSSLCRVCPSGHDGTTMPTSTSVSRIVAHGIYSGDKFLIVSLNPTTLDTSAVKTLAQLIASCPSSSTTIETNAWNIHMCHSPVTFQYVNIWMAKWKKNDYSGLFY